MTSFKCSIGAIAAAAFLVSSTASYADISPLPAGKPAGTREAALLALGPIFWIGLAVLAAGIGIAVSNNSKGVTTITTGTGG